jgi:Lipocalin-like domain
VRVLPALLLAATLSARQTAGTGAADARSLVGTWTLSSAERLAAGSAPVALPLPRGLLVFDAAGHAYELVKSGRNFVNSANQATPAEAQALFGSFGGFWGSYKADTAQKKITFRAEGAVNPNAMGPMAGDLLRTFEFADDRLVVTSGADSGDGRDNMRWTWQRVPQLENLTPANRRLVGFWRHIVEKRINVATGAVLTESPRAPSVIVYTPSGYVGVHFPPLNRQRFAGTAPTDDEARAAIAGFVSYYGSYTLYPGLVFHHRLVILANPQGDSLRRFYDITGDELNLKFPAVTNQGQEIRTVVTLKRISGERDMIPNP